MKISFELAGVKKIKREDIYEQKEIDGILQDVVVGEKEIEIEVIKDLSVTTIITEKELKESYDETYLNKLQKLAIGFITKKGEC